MRSRSLIVVGLAVLVGFFLDLGTPPLFDRDEGAFSEATREMFETGDFVSPQLNAAPRYDKPILIHWAQAIFVFAVGPNEWGFRLASAVAATLWVVVVIRFVRPRMGRDASVFVGVLMATSLGVMMLARAAIADALLNLWLTLAMFDMWRWIEDGRPGRWRVFLWMALGFLTKGPVAILVPGAVSLLFFLLRRDVRTWLACIVDPRGWLVFVLVAAPWYTVQFAREGVDFWNGFFMRHNVERFSSPLHGHDGSYLYYLPVLLIVLLPHTGLFLRTLGTIGRVRHDETARFLWLWIGFVVVFFSLSGTKLPHYVLLGVTPLFVLMSQQRERLGSRWLVMIPPVILWSLLIALPHLVDEIRARLDDPYFEATLTQAPYAFGPLYMLAASAGAALWVAGMLVYRRGALWRALPPLAILHAFLLVRFVVPSFGELLQGPTKQAALVARDTGAPTVRYQIDMPSVSVYRQMPTPRRTPRAGEVAVTKVGKLDDLRADGVAFEILYQRGGMIVVRVLHDATAR